MTALASHIKGLIRAGGPISVGEFMRIVLTGYRDSYYMRGEAFGAAGDFVTAPEISQIFGELIGLWCVDVWRQLGEPARFSLVELGPGRGTLMKDALRAARIAPAFARSASVSLVEVSPVLREVQDTALEGASVASLNWIEHFDALEMSDVPMILIANEFFDALPIRQLVRVDERWAERCIGLDDRGELTFGAGLGAVAPDVVPEALRGAARGSIVALSPVRSDLARNIGRRIADGGGAALVVDYGYAGPAAGDTLQAVKAHRFADVLADPGAADVTTHVDFTALGEAFAEGGARLTELAGQGAFLQRLGARIRLDALKRSANAQQAGQLEQAYLRLTGEQAMGSLFKVLCAYAPSSLRPAGFSIE
jgi:NADH dehydrogenase [ubiquinone] 1 alpha subcomplex assembly factor 7